MCEVQNKEEVLHNFLRDPSITYKKTGSPNILCSVLPSHWRANKQLPCKFTVVVLGHVENNTIVTLSASNEFNDEGILKNNLSYIKNNMAVFNDLRFISRSGRGKSFHVVITVGTRPSQVALYRDAIKITTDGPRMPRNKSSFIMKKNSNEANKLKKISNKKTKKLGKEFQNKTNIESYFKETNDFFDHPLDFSIRSNTGLSSNYNDSSFSTSSTLYPISVSPEPQRCSQSDDLDRSSSSDSYCTPEAIAHLNNS